MCIRDSSTDTNVAQKEFEKSQVTKKYSLLGAIPRGFQRTIDVLTMQIKQFKIVFNSKTQGYKKVSGPVSYTHLDVYKRQVQTKNITLVFNGSCFQQSLPRINSWFRPICHIKNGIVIIIVSCKHRKS